MEGIDNETGIGLELQPQTPVFQPNRLGCYPWSTLTDRGLPLNSMGK